MGQLSLFALGIIKAIILARLVGRTYFGLLAGATVWASYLSFIRLDLRLAVLSSQEEPEVLETQFLIENASALLAFVPAGLLALLWPDLIPPIVWLLVFVLLAVGQFDALTSTSVYLVDRRLRQDVMGRLTLLAAVVGFVVPVALAVHGASLAALLLNAVIPVVIPRVGAALFIRRPLRFGWDPRRLREQLRLAWTMWSTGLLGKITWELDDWLVFNLRRPHPVVWLGAGVEPEALYDRAYSVGKLPMDVAAGAIGANALALYAESATRGREVLEAAYRQLTWILSWIVFFSGTLAFVAADELVHLLGDDWLPMVPLLRIMILFVLGRPLLQNAGQLLLAVRREREFRRAMAIQAAFMVAACPLMVHFFGAAGASGVVSVMSLAGLVVVERDVARSLGRSGWSLYALPVGAATAAIGLTVLVAPALPTSLWLAALAKVGLTALVFALGLGLFDRPAAREAWRSVRRGLAER